MTDPVQLSPQTPEPQKPIKEELLAELGDYLEDNADATYGPVRNTRVLFKAQEFLFGGNFNTTVALFTVSTIGSVYFLCSDASMNKSHLENLSIISLMYGGTCVAQYLDNKKK